MTAPTHLHKLQATQGAETHSGSLKPCATCLRPFRPVREWQRFCCTRCRQTYHASMTPDALRRDLDDLKSRLKYLEEGLAVLVRALEGKAQP